MNNENNLKKYLWAPIVVVIFIMFIKFWGLGMDEIDNNIELLLYWGKLRSYLYLMLFFLFSFLLIRIFIIGGNEDLKTRFVKLFGFLFIYIIMINFTFYFSSIIYSFFEYFMK